MRAAAKEKAKRARAKLRKLPPSEDARKAEREEAALKTKRDRRARRAQSEACCRGRIPSAMDLARECERDLWEINFPAEFKKAEHEKAEQNLCALFIQKHKEKERKEKAKAA